MLNFPESIQSIFVKLANNVKSLISKSNPFLNRSLTKAMLTSFAANLWDFFKYQENVLDECFDDTRVVTLEREGSDYGLTINPALQAEGNASVMGTATTIIPDETIFSYDGIDYKVDGDQTITAITEAVALTYLDGLVTCVFTDDHNLGTGQSITISNATPTELNGLFIVAMIDNVTVTYDVDLVGSGSSSATADFNMAVLPLQSVETGEDNNRNAGEVLTLGTSIVGVDTQAYVTYDGIGGGIDEEGTEAFRERLQQRKKNPASFFNVAQVEATLREIAWVDRVFIKRCSPEVGYAQIYLVKQNNVSPSGSELTEAEDYFEPYLPINCNFDLIQILAPTGVDTSFVFTSITPDTTSMRTAIEANLDAFFLDRAEVGVTITEETYRGIIINTVDPNSLLPLTAFVLSSPTGDIAVGDGQLANLGVVTFA